MPVVCLKYKRKPWVVKYREPWSGRPRQRAFAAEAEARAFEDAQASLYERERAIIKAVRRRRTQGRPASLTIAEVLDRYLDSLGNPSTRAASAYHLRLFADIYGQRKAHCLTLEDVGAFLTLQQQRGVSKSTACRRMGIVRAAYHWAARWGLLPTNPLAGLQLASPAPQTPDPPTAREARRLYATAAPHVQRVVILGLCAGPRIGPSELFRLEWKDVDLANAMLRMPSAQKNRLEDGRDIPIRADLIPILQAWWRHDSGQGIRHVISWGGRPVRSICRAWHTALARAGIARRIRPYDLRHAFATYALAGSADIGSVASLMGHLDASMILNTYQHVQDTQKRAAVEAAPDILGLAGSTRASRLPGI